jgi:hypothetical protein
MDVRDKGPAVRPGRQSCGRSVVALYNEDPPHTARGRLTPRAYAAQANRAQKLAQALDHKQSQDQSKRKPLFRPV